MRSASESDQQEIDNALARGWYLPTPEEIDDEAEAIRGEWSEADHTRRAVSKPQRVTATEVNAPVF